MISVENNLSEHAIRESLEAFYSQALKVKATENGLVLAPLQTLPDGWQMVIRIEPGPPGKARVTDAGATLGWLHGQGQNIETDGMLEHMATILSGIGAHRDGFEISKWIETPVKGIDLHVFCEALVSIAHLHYLHDPSQRADEAADKSLRKVFADLKLNVLEKHSLKGKTERAVKLDYFIPSECPPAVQVLRRKGKVTSVMEQWGFRWQDLRKVHPRLRPAMVYDPSVQIIDEDARSIANDVCDLFCGYEETDRIAEWLEEAKG